MRITDQRSNLSAVGGLAAAVVIVIVITWAAWLRRDHPGFISTPTLIIDCVSVAVAFIPEGLPFCVTMSLSVMVSAHSRALSFLSKIYH